MFFLLNQKSHNSSQHIILCVSCFVTVHENNDIASMLSEDAMWHETSSCSCLGYKVLLPSEMCVA